MNKHFKIKKGLLIALVLVMGISAGAVFINMSAQSEGISQSDTKNNLAKFAMLQAERGKLQRKFSGDSISVNLYIASREHELLGVSKDRSLELAESGIVEHEALYYMAIQAGFKLSSEELKEKMAQHIIEGKSADNYKEIEAACQMNGSNFEQNITMRRRR